jgi:hypothetical protein
MRILVAIESCWAHTSRHAAQEETWLKDLTVDYRFFVGCLMKLAGSLPLNTTELAVDDSYHALSMKTREICRWVLDNDYDFVFKTDTDTLVSARNLLDSGFEKHYYYGGENEDDMPASLLGVFPNMRIQFASGGAGYWLNRRAAMLVAYGPTVTSPAEDVYVAAILKANDITPVWSSGYRWRPGETVDKDMISLHLSSALQKPYEAEQMYKGYKKLKDRENV